MTKVPAFFKPRVLLVVSVLSAACGVVKAQAPAWPADFLTQVSNRVSQVAPTGTAVGEKTMTEAFDSTAWSKLASAAYGSELYPLDSYWKRVVVSIPYMINGEAPTGLTILIR